LAQQAPWPAPWPGFREPPLPLPPRSEIALASGLFLATAASVFAVGAFTLVERAGILVTVFDVRSGLELAFSLLAILLAHEFGHYVACRYYRVDSTLPYFIPLPVFTLAGTLGAFIKIRAPIPHRRALFDIGVAGPLAGFAVCLPVLVMGVLQGTWAPLTNNGEGPGYFGEPLLFEWCVRLLKGPAPENSTLVIGPYGLAAWFGLFVTALNMMPVGQLDGGHVTHALFPRHAHLVSRAGLLVCLGLLYFRPTWMLWTLLLWLLARRPHPPTLDEQAPVGRARLWVGLLSYAVFALSFTPHPILISWAQFFEMLGLTSR
jgi:membrane-associated protease RseP (regulator of RpoE activity)